MPSMIQTCACGRKGILLKKTGRCIHCSKGATRNNVATYGGRQRAKPVGILKGPSTSERAADAEGMLDKGPAKQRARTKVGRQRIKSASSPTLARAEDSDGMYKRNRKKAKTRRNQHRSAGGSTLTQQKTTIRNRRGKKARARRKSAKRWGRSFVTSSGYNAFHEALNEGLNAKQRTARLEQRLRAHKPDARGAYRRGWKEAEADHDKRTAKIAAKQRNRRPSAGKIARCKAIIAKLQRNKKPTDAELKQLYDAARKAHAAGDTTTFLKMGAVLEMFEPRPKKYSKRLMQEFGRRAGATTKASRKPAKKRMPKRGEPVFFGGRWFRPGDREYEVRLQLAQEAAAGVEHRNRGRGSGQVGSSAPSSATVIIDGPGGRWSTLWHATSRSWGYRAPKAIVRTGFASESAAATAMRKHVRKLRKQLRGESMFERNRGGKKTHARKTKRRNKGGVEDPSQMPVDVLLREAKADIRRARAAGDVEYLDAAWDFASEAKRRAQTLQQRTQANEMLDDIASIRREHPPRAPAKQSLDARAKGAARRVGSGIKGAARRVGKALGLRNRSGATTRNGSKAALRKLCNPRSKAWD